MNLTEQQVRAILACSGFAAPLAVVLDARVPSADRIFRELARDWFRRGVQ